MPHGLLVHTDCETISLSGLTQQSMNRISFTLAMRARLASNKMSVLCLHAFMSDFPLIVLFFLDFYLYGSTQLCTMAVLPLCSSCKHSTIALIYSSYICM